MMLCKDFTEVVTFFTGFIKTPKATGKLFQDKKQLVEFVVCLFEKYGS